LKVFHLRGGIGGGESTNNQLTCQTGQSIKEATMLGLGLPEILLILVIALLIFGAAKLPEIGRSLGRALSEFKKGTQGITEIKDEKHEK